MINNSYQHFEVGKVCCTSPTNGARKLVISVHIPKTAGTSLVAEIKRGVFGHFILDYTDRPMQTGVRVASCRLISRLQMRLRHKEMLRDVGIVHGHFLTGKYAFLHPIVDFITFMREPVSRVLSQYYYFKNVASKNSMTLRLNPNINLVAQGLVDIVEFARGDLLPHIYERFMDGMALEEFALVGITERYVESINLLNSMFGTAIEPKHERRTNHIQYLADYEHLLPELKAANRENTRIYELALKLFEQHLRRA